MKKKILALLMAAAMMMAATACGSTETTETSTGETTTETTETEENTTTEETSAEETSNENNDTFTVAISYMPDTLAPHSGGSDDYTSMTRPLYDKLFIDKHAGGLEQHLDPSQHSA